LGHWDGAQCWEEGSEQALNPNEAVKLPERDIYLLREGWHVETWQWKVTFWSCQVASSKMQSRHAVRGQVGLFYGNHTASSCCSRGGTQSHVHSLISASEKSKSSYPICA
jgi:hypothetical protein